MAHLALLWHLHQPDYADPRTGRPVMPWTRMHALRGYRDLAIECVEQQVAATINLVPSLLDQLLWYAAGGDDDHLVLSARPADSLLPEEVARVRGTFVTGHPAMCEAHASYAALRERVRSDDELSGADLRDLQVWSTLAWFGATARRDFPALGELMAKGSAYTEDDKLVMLEVQARLLADLPDRFSALSDSPTRLSTTPYYHPILPLLVDVQHARRNLPHVPIDFESAWPEDALLHLELARKRMREVLGLDVRGLWPSEGSVSPEVVELAAKAGFRWLASDEQLLGLSERDSSRNNGSWDLGHGVRGFFRDRELSDAIGFRYATRDGAEAAAEFLAAVHQRADGGVVTVALDGENPWESYADAGHAFRTALHAGLKSGPVRGITMEDACELKPVGRVQQLHTGSWINADFGIWFGHPDDRMAWRLVADCRRAIANEADPTRREAALKKLLPAQGSDWTWWYGEDFSTEFARVFDTLFRDHVRAAWQELQLEPPSELDQPIGGAQRSRTQSPVQRLGDEGRVWADWVGSGTVRWDPQGSMAVGVRHSTGLRFGWTESGQLRLRIEGARAVADAHWLVSTGDQELKVSATQMPVVEVPVEDPSASVSVSVSLIRDGQTLARFPERGGVRLAAPESSAHLWGWV